MKIILKTNYLMVLMNWYDLTVRIIYNDIACDIWFYEGLEQCWKMISWQIQACKGLVLSVRLEISSRHIWCDNVIR